MSRAGRIQRTGEEVGVPLEVATPMVCCSLGNPTRICPVICSHISSVQSTIHQIVTVPTRVYEVHVLWSDVQVCPGRESRASGGCALRSCPPFQLNDLQKMGTVACKPCMGSKIIGCVRGNPDGS